MLKLQISRLKLALMVPAILVTALIPCNIAGGPPASGGGSGKAIVSCSEAGAPPGSAGGKAIVSCSEAGAPPGGNGK